jgi:hypothetical protein
VREKERGFGVEAGGLKSRDSVQGKIGKVEKEKAGIATSRSARVKN